MLIENPALTLHEVLQKAVERNPQRYVVQAMDGDVQARYMHARGVLPAAPAVSLRHLNDTIGSGRGEREWEAELELPVWLPGQRNARQAVASESQADLAASRERLALQVAGVLRDTVWDIAMNANNVDVVRQRRVQFMIQTTHEISQHLVGELREKFTGVGLHYFILPVSEAGRL